MNEDIKSDVYFNIDLQALIGPDGNMIPLRPKTCDVLRLLAERAGNIVTKDEIIARAWNNEAITDDSIYQCISEIRQALKKAGNVKVRTLSKKGYVIDQSINGNSSSISLKPIEIPTIEEIKYTSSADGTRLAWSASGHGIPVLKTPNWITHLGAERRSKLYGPFYNRLGERARVVRYDQRGGGMSSWSAGPLTIEAMCEDILAVADASGLDRFNMLGISQGVAFAIAFAARHPERVKSIVGRGGYAMGDLAGGGEKNRKTYESGLQMIKVGWESDDPTFRRNFTSRLAPDASPEMAMELDELQRIAIPKENLVEFFEFDARLDVSSESKLIQCPVLLIHSVRDRMVPFEDGQHLASLLPNCTFVAVDSDNHTWIPGRNGFEEGMQAIDDFYDRLET